MKNAFGFIGLVGVVGVVGFSSAGAGTLALLYAFKEYILGSASTRQTFQIDQMVRNGGRARSW